MASILRRNQPFEDLPEEMLSEILSYLAYLTNKEKLNVSLVNKRWFLNFNLQIEDIQIRRPINTDNLGDLQNYINRFENLRSLSLASKINNYSELLPLKSLDLRGKSIEFDVNENLIPTKNRRNDDFATYIKRIKVEDFQNFARFEYKPFQVICLHFVIEASFEAREAEYFERANEEIMSLNSLRRISLDFWNVSIPRGFFEAILTRPKLKQIDFKISCSNLGSEIEQGLIKNSMVEEITFGVCGPRPGAAGEPFFSDLKKFKALSDALPNIKRVRVVTRSDNAIENLPEILKIISDFKKLESLHCAICGLGNSGVEKIQDLLNIIKDFPIKAKVVIAEINYRNVANLIEKEEGKPPKIVKPWYPLSGSSFLPKPM